MAGSARRNPNSDADFRPQVELPPRSGRVLASDFKSVADRLEQSLTLLRDLAARAQQDRPVPVAWVREQADRFFQTYGQTARDTVPPRNVAALLRRWLESPSIAARSTRRPLEVQVVPRADDPSLLGQLTGQLVGSQAFQQDLAQFEDWFLMEARRFLTTAVPQSLRDFMRALLNSYSNPDTLADLHSKLALAYQIETQHDSYVERTRDFPTSARRVSAAEFGVRADEDTDRPGGDPDLGLPQAWDKFHAALSQQAEEYGRAHYGSAIYDHALRAGPVPFTSLLISHHPIAGLFRNDPVLWGSLKKSLRGQRDEIDAALQQLVHQAGFQLREAHDLFVELTKDHENFPWARLGPFLRSFGASVGVERHELTRLIDAIVETFLEEHKTFSDQLSDIGMALGLASQVIGLAAIVAGSGGTAVPGALVAVEFVACGLSFVTDTGTFAVQFSEEADAEILNRIALVDGTADQFPTGTAGGDLFTYFVFLVGTSLLARGIERFGMAAVRKVKVGEFKEETTRVISEIDTRQVSRPEVLADREVAAGRDRLTGAASRGTREKRVSSGTLAANRVVNPEVGPMSRIPPDVVRNAEQTLQSVKAELDAEIVRMAERLDLDVVQIVDEARRLGFRDPNLAILQSMNFRVGAIEKFIRVRLVLVDTIEALNEATARKEVIEEAIKRLGKKKPVPEALAAERMQLQKRIKELEADKREARKWLGAAEELRTPQSQGDWAEHWQRQTENLIAPNIRNFPGFDFIRPPTGRPVSTKSIRFDETAYAASKKDARFSIESGRKSIDDAIKKYETAWKDPKTLQRTFEEHFPRGTTFPKGRYAHIEKEISLIYLAPRPEPVLEAQIVRELTQHLALAAPGGGYILRVQHASMREIMGLNAPEVIDRLKGLRVPVLPAIAPKSDRESTQEPARGGGPE